MKKIILILIILVACLAGVLFLVPKDNNLIITRSAISLDESSQQIISGTVENKTANKTYNDVEVDVIYLNANKKIIGQDSFKTNSVGPHMVWGFKGEVKIDGVSSFRIKVSSPQFLGLRW